MRTTFVVVHEVWIMDPPRDYPVVTREFRGDTREDAYAAYLAHYENDPVLRRCVEQDEYALPSGEVARCVVRGWYDDDDARVERIAHAWTEARRGGRPSAAATTSRPRAPVLQPEDVPPVDGGAPHGFQPRVIEGGAGRPSGHENHDPNVCDVRTG